MEPVTMIHVSDQAFMTILLSGLEAYKVALAEDEEQSDAVEQVPMEFFGHLFGTCTVREGGKYFSVEHVSIDSTALQGDVGVRPNPHSLMLKDALINFCWPHYQYLGYVHSHPYESAKEMQSNKGFLLSDEDKEYCDAYDDILLLMSIGKLTYPPEGEPCFYKDKSNVLKLEIANFRILLSAYPVDLSEEDEECDDDETGVFIDDEKENIILDCPALMGMIWNDDRTRYPHGNAFSTVMNCLRSNLE